MSSYIVFDHIYHSFQTTPFPWPPNFIFYLFYLTHEVYFLLPIDFRKYNLHWSVLPTRGCILTENCLSSQCLSTPRSSLAGVGMSRASSSCCNFVWSEFAQTLCIVCQMLWIIFRHCLPVSIKQYFIAIHLPRLTILLPVLPRFWSLVRRACFRDVPFRLSILESLILYSCGSQF